MLHGGLLIVGRRHGSGIHNEQQLRCIENRLATATAHPALRGPQLLLGYAKNRSASLTTGGQTHAASSRFTLSFMVIQGPPLFRFKPFVQMP
jgi:hypothetical protein